MSPVKVFEEINAILLSLSLSYLVQVNLDIDLEVWSLFNFKVNADID